MPQSMPLTDSEHWASGTAGLGRGLLGGFADGAASCPEQTERLTRSRNGRLEVQSQEGTRSGGGQPWPGKETSVHDAAAG